MNINKKANVVILASLILFGILILGCIGKETQKAQSVTPQNLPQDNESLTYGNKTSSGAESIETIEIKIKNFQFLPSVITIRPNTIVKWTNEESVPHNIVIINVTESQTLRNGDVFEYKFEIKGTYEYHCGIHPSMRGKIIVE
ncbi:MAG: cupredoxin domain-containing protein [Candidatus Micrarchaeota archaeon]|nr:cupredoxin domain-containing protein [Candidatus Micrarchaeota archaeon]